MKNWQIQLISYGVLAVGLVVFIVVVGNYVGPEEERQGGVLKKLASEIQYPGARLTWEHVGLDVNEANFNAHYKTHDDFNKVVGFYHQQLTSRGWIRVEGKHNSIFVGPFDRTYYHKTGGYRFSIYDGDTQEYDFIVYINWSRP